MNEVTASIDLDIPIERAWALLSDLTGMRNYMPGLAEVAVTSSAADGVGATRHCRFEDGVELTERPVHVPALRAEDVVG